MECKKGVSYDDCELAILRMAVDKVENIKGKRKLSNEIIKRIIRIVEDFLRKKKCICYGGTAINNILPDNDQFYNKNVEFPDYDFFSPRALQHAKQLADIYHKEGFEHVEAKAGMHSGTYKVYVNFIPVADITSLDKEIFDNLKKEAIVIDKIHYAPANFLRMAMYLELSRPMGDISRWEKVLKRIRVLNKNYPMKGLTCEAKDIQRIFETNKVQAKNVFDELRNVLIDEQVVFFGAMAHKMYSRYMDKSIYNSVKRIPDFDVLTQHPEEVAKRVKSKLENAGFNSIKIVKQPPIGELVSEHYELKIYEDTVLFLYRPLACHSYNVIRHMNKNVKIATIDTMLSFYLAFLYSSRTYYDRNRLLCMCEYLFKVQEKNRLAQKGLLRRFSIKCIGQQESLEDIRGHKSELFTKLKSKKGTIEYEKAFLNYDPKLKKTKRNVRSKKLTKKKKKKKKTIFDLFHKN